MWVPCTLPGEVLVCNCNVDGNDAMAAGMVTSVTGVIVDCMVQVMDCCG